MRGVLPHRLSRPDTWGMAGCAVACSRQSHIVLHCMYRHLVQCCVADCHDTVDRRGEYQVGTTIVTIQDPLRVFSLSRIFSSAQRVTAFPQLLSFPRLRIALTSPLDGQRVRFAPNYDTSQLTDTHPYANDPLNHIHWKVTAHTGAIYAKDFSPSRPSRLGMHTGVLLPPSRLRLRANRPPIRAPSR